VFRYAVRKMFEVCQELLHRNGFDPTTTIPVGYRTRPTGRIIAATARAPRDCPSRELS